MNQTKKRENTIYVVRCITVVGVIAPLTHPPANAHCSTVVATLPWQRSVAGQLWLHFNNESCASFCRAMLFLSLSNAKT